MDSLSTTTESKERGRGIAIHRWSTMKKWFQRDSTRSVWNHAEYGNKSSMNYTVNLSEQITNRVMEDYKSRTWN